jgi:hypothetical protein
MVGNVSVSNADATARNVAVFREALSETGYVEGQNVAAPMESMA